MAIAHCLRLPCTSISTAPQKHFPLCAVIDLVSFTLATAEFAASAFRINGLTAERNDGASALFDAASGRCISALVSACDGRALIDCPYGLLDRKSGFRRAVLKMLTGADFQRPTGEPERAGKWQPTRSSIS